jgi:hypothetical protein
MPYDVRIPIREGRYEYVRVAPDGAATTLVIDEEARAAGVATVAVSDGDRVLEVNRSSTSDPDFEPARGQLWPEEAS